MVLCFMNHKLEYEHQFIGDDAPVSICHNTSGFCSETKRTVTCCDIVPANDNL